MLHVYFYKIINLSLNFLLIPILGFVGPLITLVCYFCMSIVSFYLGRKHYRIPYPIKRIFMYLGLVFILFFTSILFNLGIVIKTIFILLFIFIAFILEKPKKAVISNPKLFD